MFYNKFMVSINLDKHTCCVCGKKSKGHYDIPKSPGKYVCHKCVLRRIKSMPKQTSAKQTEKAEG